MSALLLTMSLMAQASVECPAFLRTRIVGDRARAQAYADCMTQPWLPTADQLAAKQRECATNKGGKDEWATRWVDHIATNFPGCETRIEFIRK